MRFATFRMEKHSNVLTGYSTDRWDLFYDAPQMSGLAGFAYRGEDGRWVGCADHLQKSDCRTRKEALEWVKATWKSNR